MKSAASSVSSATENVREVKGVKVLATRADNLERTQLRTLVDNLRNKLGSGVVVMGSVSDGKVALIVGVTKDLTSRVQAGKIIAEVAKKVGGSGGGRPDMAEAGGKDPGGVGCGPGGELCRGGRVAAVALSIQRSAFSQAALLRRCRFLPSVGNVAAATGKQQVPRLRCAPLGMTSH